MAQRDHADLEIGLQRRELDSYLVDLRYTPPDGDADNRLAAGEAVSFDPALLREKEQDPAAYGKALAEMLFAPQAVRDGLSRARAVAESANVPLRLRLFIDGGARELHDLRWETLRDPAGDTPLLTSEQLLFSRYLSSGDWRPITLRPQAKLRALAVVANPVDIARFSLGAIDAPAELQRARQGMGAIEVSEQSGTGQATLNKILERLREGYDILYLVCHGAMIRGKPVLYLEDDAGNTAAMAGSDLVTRMSELRERPRLVVLASCQSAGEGEPSTVDSSPLAAIGPRLAEAGIPAVLAMQGKVAMSTVATFMPAFFTALQSHGEIDRAVAVARGSVRERPDSWMPVLFMRLRSGKIWYTPGFTEGDAYEKWPALIANIGKGNCTPIIGPHLNDSTLGSQQDMAQYWAEEFRFPMAPDQRDDLPQVAQYLAVTQDYNLPRAEMEKYLRRSILERYGKAMQNVADNAPLRDLFANVSRIRREADSFDPYQTLAKLPFRVFVTANTDSLLGEALRAADKQPMVEICRWKEDLVQKPSQLLKDPDYTPSEKRPLIFHLFGINTIPESLVLTEDDYFDYLIGVSLNKKLIPEIVRDALVDRSLLFLGFRLEEWSFRVLFRSLMSHGGASRHDRYANVAGQILPEEGAFLQPERARAYLQRYFVKSSIDIFWGSVDDFIKELHAEWEKQGGVAISVGEEDPFY